MIKYLILFIVITSCSTKNKVIRFEKNDYLIQNNKSYITANYSEIKTINESSNYKFVIKNNSSRYINLFSTIIENSNMFYSIKNYKFKRNKLLFNSFYNDYMSDAEHSGVKKFSFIKIKPNDSLTINLDEKFIKKGIDKISLNYLFFYSNEQLNLIDINEIKIISKNINVRNVPN